MGGFAPRVLIVDLNNFARYPTVAVGLLAAVLRQAGMHTRIFSPLSLGVTGVAREPRTRPWSIVDQKLRYWSAVSSNRLIRMTRARLAALHGPKLAKQSRSVARRFEQQLAHEQFDAVLVSTYLMYYPLCEMIGQICQQRKIPLIIGGAYFSQPEVVEQWENIDGLQALVTGEVEAQLPQIVQKLAAGEDLTGLPGIHVPGTHFDGPAPPFRELDSLPFPDYSDFPWDRYPNTIVPICSARGCGWGACTFCSDITSTAGRTFRSRSPAHVLGEIQHQHRKHGAKLFAFVDLKLNSNLPLWTALLQNFQQAAPGSKWIAAVHIGSNAPNGLSRDELRAARASGMVRLTTGLESGSQRVLDSMCKGTELSVTSSTLRNACEAGISVRTTMVLGYPGEEEDDVIRSAEFLVKHSDCIERVSLNRFMIMTGTRFHRRLEKSPQSFPGITQLTVNHRLAQIEHRYAPTRDPGYRRAVSHLLSAVHQINRKPLRSDARDFEGVM